MFHTSPKNSKSPVNSSSSIKYRNSNQKSQIFTLPLPSFKPSVMANKREFEIAFVGLKPGIHEFNYEVDDKFFVDKGVIDFTGCHANIKLSLDKKSSFMLLKFEVGGKADVTCDRCGNPLPMDIWDEFNMLVKLVENPDEMNDQEEDPDVFYISRTESHVNVASWIYDFVLLSFPMQKMCSEEAMGGPQCNNEVLEKLRAMEVREQEANSNQLWKGLEQFKAKKKSKK
jgi:uncharacterized metal-binding protein YceD (DUF177 family)